MRRGIVDGDLRQVNAEPRKQATSLPKEIKNHEDTGLYHVFGKLKGHDRGSCRYWSGEPDLMLRLHGLLRSKSSWLLGR